MNSRTHILATLVAIALIAPAAQAGAQQWNPEEGGGGWDPPPDQQQPPPQQQTPPPQQQTPPPQQQTPPPAQQGGWYNGSSERPPGMGGEQPPTAGPTGDSDHAQVVGDIAVTFFGNQRVAIDPDADGDGVRVRVNAPTIGIRTWFSDSIGLDAGLGLGFSSFSLENNGEIVGGTFDSVFAINVHVGLPVALAQSGHFTALLIPEIDFAYGGGTVLDAATPELDMAFSGIQLAVTARLGAEVHFGFWDIPQLSVQATVGLGIGFNSQTMKNDADIIGGIRTNVEASDFSIFTTANDIFNGTIRANYYF